MQFQTKAERVEAVRFNPDEAVPSWALPVRRVDNGDRVMLIKAPGKPRVGKGDWIVRTADGVLRAMTDEAFRETYTEVFGAEDTVGSREPLGGLEVDPPPPPAAIGTGEVDGTGGGNGDGGDAE